MAANVYDCKWKSIQEYLGHTHIVDIGAALKLFSPDRSKALQLFNEYMQGSNDDQCLDDYVRVKMSDSEVKCYLVTLGIPNSSFLQQMKREERDAIILKLKGLKGVTHRQLSRITGISKGVITRAR